MSLFSPLKIGHVNLENRIVLAPLTRIRADTDLVPTDDIVEYYSQRAHKGSLLISEATFINAQTIASRHIPGIFTDKQQAGWKKVVDAIHAKGAFFSMQLWHQGRLAHPSYSKFDGTPTCYAPSAIPYEGQVLDYDDQLVSYTTPTPFSLEDIENLKQDYVNAAQRALDAGVDLLELHGAHGYLLQQFQCDGTNQRTDHYGGSIENRCRLTVELVELLVNKFGADKIAIRLSPFEKEGFFGVTDSNPNALYNYLFKALEPFNLAYILVTEDRWNIRFAGNPEEDPMVNVPCLNLSKYREVYKNTLIGAGGFTPENAKVLFENPGDKYEAVAFGRWFIANPDLVFRIKEGLPLNSYNRTTFYIGQKWDEADKGLGYTDYPTFEQSCVAAGYTLEQVLADRSLVGKVVEHSKSSGKYYLIPQDIIGSSQNSNERK